MGVIDILGANSNMHSTTGLNKCHRHRDQSPILP